MTATHPLPPPPHPPPSCLPPSSTHSTPHTRHRCCRFPCHHTPTPPAPPPYPPAPPLWPHRPTCPTPPPTAGPTMAPSGRTSQQRPLAAKEPRSSNAAGTMTVGAPPLPPPPPPILSNFKGSRCIGSPQPLSSGITGAAYLRSLDWLER